MTGTLGTTLAMPALRGRARSTDEVVGVPSDGPLVPRVPRMERDVRVDGLRFVLQPTGVYEGAYLAQTSMIDVNLGPVPARLAWNSDRLHETEVPADSLCFVPRGGEFRFSVVNHLPGFLVEIEPSYWPDSLREEFGFGGGADGSAGGSGGSASGAGFGGDRSSRGAVDFLSYEHDPVAAELGRAGMRLLMEDHRSGERADALALEGIAMGLIGRVAKRLDDDRSVARGRPTPSALARRRLRMVTEYVESELHRTIQVADLAELVAMSASHFARCFKLATGVAPARYVVIRRIARAQLLLVQGDLSIAQVALACGFSGQAHLTRAFKDATGTTPGEFRRGGRR